MRRLDTCNAATYPARLSTESDVLMATPEQRANRRAQRANARNLRQRDYTPVIPRSTKAGARAAREAYGHRVMAGTDPRPPKESREGKNLARLASLAKVGKVDPAFEEAFKDYWYHKDDEKNEADIEDNADTESSGDSADSDED
jgi:hypothetical protein